MEKPVGIPPQSPFESMQERELDECFFDLAMSIQQWRNSLAKLAPNERQRIILKTTLELHARSESALDSFLAQPTRSAWDAWRTWGHTEMGPRISDLCEIVLTDPAVADDRGSLISYILDLQRESETKMILEKIASTTEKDRDQLVESLAMFLSSKARPTERYLGRNTYKKREPEEEGLLRMADEELVKIVDSINEWTRGRLETFPASIVDKICVGLYERGADRPSTFRTLMEAHKRSEENSEEARRRLDLLLDLQKKDGRQAIPIVTYLLERMLARFVAHGATYEMMGEEDRIVIRMLAEIRENLQACTLNPTLLTAQLDRFVELATQAPPQSFRIDLASTIWMASRMLDLDSSLKEIQLYKGALEKLKHLSYERLFSEDLEGDTAEIQDTISEFIKRCDDLLEEKAKQSQN